MLLLLGLVTQMLSASLSTIQKLFTNSVKWALTSKRYQLADILLKNCFLLRVRGLVIAYIICCRVNVTLDIILGIEDILISWFVIIRPPETVISGGLMFYRRCLFLPRDLRGP